MLFKTGPARQAKSYMCYSKNNTCLYFEFVLLVLYCRFISKRTCLGRACIMAEGPGSSLLLTLEYRTRIWWIEIFFAYGCYLEMFLPSRVFFLLLDDIFWKILSCW